MILLWKFINWERNSNFKAIMHL